MFYPEITRDGSVLVEALVAPARGLAAVAERRRSLAAIVAATIAALAFSAAAVPNTDFTRTASAVLDRSPKAAEMTPHDREEAIALAQKLGAIGLWANGAAAAAIAAVAAAAALWAAFRVAGTGPGFRPTLAVAAHGLLPFALAKVLAIPAILARAPVAAEDLARILPSSPAALLPASASPALAAALGGIDLFALWGLALVALGMSRVSGASRARSAVVVAALWIAYVAVLRVAPAAAAAALGVRGGA